jgi:hypothetical protein
MKEGKDSFYPKVEEALRSAGYEYYDGDRDLKGKTSQHRRKPDFMAVKEKAIVIGEIKSPDEPPTSGSWRQRQPYDTKEFASVRAEVKAREEDGAVDPEVGGHEIIIRGQIPDYAANVGITYDAPVSMNNRVMVGGYAVPLAHASQVEKALNNCGKKSYEVVDGRNGAIVFLFDI